LIPEFESQTRRLSNKIANWNKYTQCSMLNAHGQAVFFSQEFMQVNDNIDTNVKSQWHLNRAKKKDYEKKCIRHEIKITELAFYSSH
jgi:hypothetical protein